MWVAKDMFLAVANLIAFIGSAVSTMAKLVVYGGAAMSAMAKPVMFGVVAVWSMAYLFVFFCVAILTMAKSCSVRRRLWQWRRRSFLSVPTRVRAWWV